MKRLIIIALALLIVLVVTLPGAVGYLAERGHEELAGQLARNDEAAEADYQRGWFSSRSHVSFRIEDERLIKLAAVLTEEPVGNPELIVKSRIYHGPVPRLAGGRTTIAWTDVDSSLSLRAPSGAEIPLPGELSSRVEADGSTRFRYRASPESRALQEGLTLSWDEIEVDVSVSRDRNSIGVDGEIGRIELSDGDVTMAIGQSTVASRQQRRDSGLWTGDLNLEIAGLTTAGLSAGKITLESRMRESGELADYTLLIDAGDLEGAQFGGDSARADFGFERLDAPALVGLMNLAQTHTLEKLPPKERDELLSRLLRAGPVMTLRELRLPTPDANIEGEGEVSVLAGTGPGYKELARGVSGNATLFLPITLVERAEAEGTQEVRNAIGLMKGFGLLVKDGNRYRLKAAYSGGLLTLNGFPVPVPVF